MGLCSFISWFCSDEGLKRKGVVGSDIEEEKAFYKIDGSPLPSQDEDGDICKGKRNEFKMWGWEILKYYFVEFA